jgi:1-acyl-sn-glycerol-3-phosphate acyltransferase
MLKYEACNIFQIMKPQKEVLLNRFITLILKKLIFSITDRFIKKICGRENIIKNKPFIIASNHVSYMDPFVLYSIFTKKNNFKIHLMGSTGIKWIWRIFGGERVLKWAIGAIPTPERRGQKPKIPSIDLALNILKKGGIVGIFPYPKFDPREKIRIKTGVARLALLVKVPVVPVALMGTYSVLGNKKPQFPKTYKKVIEVKIGKPLYFDKYYHLIGKGWNKDRRLFRKVSKQVVNKIERMRKSNF